MDKKKIMFINGSLKAKSTNQMLAGIVKELIGDRAEVFELDYHEVPLMNPDIEFPTPDAVQKARDLMNEADGVWIFFPEYNHSYPGVLKNLLDWLSRPVEKGAPRTSCVTSQVPVTFSSVSGKGGAVKAFEKMFDLMEKIHMNAMTEPLAAFSEPAMEDGKLALTDEQTELLKAQTEAFLAFIGSQTDRAKY